MTILKHLRRLQSVSLHRCGDGVLPILPLHQVHTKALMRDNKSQGGDTMQNGKQNIPQPEQIDLELYVHPVQKMTCGVVPGKGPPPEPPAMCCMSGCANCVWIQYAEKLKQYYSDGDHKAKEEIKKIDDHNLKAYLLSEIK